MPYIVMGFLVTSLWLLVFWGDKVSRINRSIFSRWIVYDNRNKRLWKTTLIVITVAVTIFYLLSLVHLFIYSR